MFSVQDYIVYGTSGVCLVDSVIPSPFGPQDERLYYVLKPVHEIGDSTIFTPVDNAQVAMRPLISAKEAAKLLKRLDDISILRVDAEKERRDRYRAVLASQIPEEYISLLKTVAKRRSDCIAAHKRLPDMDNEYESRARHCLCCELSIVLGETFESMEELMNTKLACE
ncbi:MAG: CarD family transcriptional regulator [Clostridia bacterium]|nr:CarD family transcriptional regulator [Clostridia bacterium]